MIAHFIEESNIIINIIMTRTCRKDSEDQGTPVLTFKDHLVDGNQLCVIFWQERHKIYCLQSLRRKWSIC